MNRRQQARASAPTEPSNRLPVLIEEIKQYEGVARNQGKAWLMTRLDEGDRLQELKDSVEHGRWLPLLRELGIHEMRARRYMRLAEHRTLIEAKSDSESDLGMTDALNCIQDFEEQKKRKADKEYQAERQKREECNRKALARELKRRAAEAARLKAASKPETIVLEPPCEPPMEPPEGPPPIVAKAVMGFTHCVRNCLALVGTAQRAEFFKQARGVLDATEKEQP